MKCLNVCAPVVAERVAPLAGAWIEIVTPKIISSKKSVAPRMGCVDQNLGPSFSENP